MYDRSLWEATPLDTSLHRLDVRLKLAIFAALAAAAILLDSSRSLFLLFCFSLSLHLWARSSFARWRILLVFILLGIWGSMTSQALFYSREPRTMVACLLPPSLPVLGALTGGVFVYREGLEYGALQALRSSIMLSLGLLVSWTSDPRRLLKSFLGLKMPYELAFMLITGLRFLPVIFQETAVVLTAQRLRGFAPLKTVWPRNVLRSAFQTLFPILARTIRRAATLAASVESRGFGRDVTTPACRRWNTGETLLCISVTVLILTIVALKALDTLQYNGLVYLPAWRNLYDGMKVWL